MERGKTAPLERAHATRSSGTFVRGRDALHSDDVHTARPLLESAAREEPNAIEVELYACWSAYLASTETRDAQRELRWATLLARRALEAGSARALALTVLAQNALLLGDRQTALTFFRRAGRMDPTLLSARRGARMVERAMRESAARGEGGTRGARERRRGGSGIFAIVRRAVGIVRS